MTHPSWGEGIKTMPKITVLSRTIKTNKMPDIAGFVEAMKEMGAKVTTKEGKILIDLRLEGKDHA